MEESNQNQALPPDRLGRRERVPETDDRSVLFVDKTLTTERLEVLREFLKHASTDEIAMIRLLYGDNPEVARFIGLETAG
ncbi:MAG TPA: hypothetical protein V6D08_16255 [Candidatus Obscuribacterales bacterium]